MGYYKKVNIQRNVITVAVLDMHTPVYTPYCSHEMKIWRYFQTDTLLVRNSDGQSLAWRDSSR